MKNIPFLGVNSDNESDIYMAFWQSKSVQTASLAECLPSEIGIVLQLSITSDHKTSVWTLVTKIWDQWNLRLYSSKTTNIPDKVLKIEL